MFRDIAHRLFVENIYYKLLAASLVVVLYVWVLGDRDVVVSVFTPVRTTVPDGMILTSRPVDRVKVTVRGRWSAIQRLGDAPLNPITIETSRKRREEEVVLSPDLVRAPPGVRVMSVRPGSMQITLQEKITKTVPIRPRLTGKPREGYKISTARVTPDTITLEGPRAQVEPVLAVWTDPVDLSEQTTSFQKEVSVRYEGALVRDNLPGDVRVQISIASVQIERTLQKLPVRVVNTTLPSTLTPRQADVVVVGPREVVEQLDHGAVLISLDMSEDEKKGPGLYQRRPTVRNLPPGVTLKSMTPTDFQVQLGAPPTAPQPDPTAPP